MNKIEEYLAKRQSNLNNSFAKYQDNKEQIDKILEKLEPFATIISYDNSLDLSIAGDTKIFTKVVRILRTSGYVPTLDLPKEKVSSWYGFFRHETNGIVVWINFTSTVCRRVKVGTKLVEQDIYEIKCDGDPE